MSIYEYLFLIFVFSILIVTGILLIGFIGGNFRTGQSLREGLSQRLGMLRMKKMLGKRDIGINDYLHKSRINDIERHIRACESCDRTDECEAALNTNKADLSFCPNDSEFENVKIKLS